jgi:hypothetical protein
LRRLILIVGMLAVTPFLRADELAVGSATATATEAIPTYAEIPYYVRQLNEATVERRRIELTKIIHNAVVNADLSDKRVVKAMEPTIEKIRAAIAAGLDRAYLEGSSMWLGSAVDYFEREKLRPTVEIPESDWLTDEISTDNGGRLNVTPDKIWLIQKDKNLLVAESSNIHETVITPDGRRAAFIREANDRSRAEIWAVNVKSRARKKIASVPSCLTLLIATSGHRIFFQERPADADHESNVWSIGFGGGSPKNIGQVRLLQTVVKKGRYKNALIVYKKRRHHLGISSQECAYAWDEHGREIGRLKNIACR